jgi:sterol desaturase/sphingolipid hydroxylase (fatty acid hydroxylase superfamily)
MIDIQQILDLEPHIRILAFGGVFVVMAGCELMWPKRALTVSKSLRWISNIALVVFNTVLARLVLPMAPVIFAGLCLERGWGLFNLVELPLWWEVLLAVVIMDFAIWAQHVMVHVVPILWRLHRVHHADQDLDVTSGARFHPLEILLSLGIKFCVIAAIGASPVAVLAFEVILNAMAMFNHANVRLPLALDAVLRLILVTPDFHRVHHSVIARETNANYGFNLSIWDRLFHTYIAQPKLGHLGMTIGLEYFRSPTEQRLDKMISQPFRAPNEAE